MRCLDARGRLRALQRPCRLVGIDNGGAGWRPVEVRGRRTKRADAVSQTANQRDLYRVAGGKGHPCRLRDFDLLLRGRGGQGCGGCLLYRRSSRLLQLPVLAWQPQRRLDVLLDGRRGWRGRRRFLLSWGGYRGGHFSHLSGGCRRLDCGAPIVHLRTGCAEVRHERDDGHRCRQVGFTTGYGVCGHCDNANCQGADCKPGDNRREKPPVCKPGAAPRGGRSWQGRIGCRSLSGARRCAEKGESSKKPPFVSAVSPLAVPVGTLRGIGDHIGRQFPGEPSLEVQPDYLVIYT